MLQMSQVDSVFTEKTCLSRIHDSSIYVEQVDTNKSVVLIVPISKLKFYFLIKIEITS